MALPPDTQRHQERTNNDIFGAIAELKAQSRNHEKVTDRVIESLDRINGQLATLASVSTELTRHRDADHDMHNQIAGLFSAVHKRLDSLEKEMAVNTSFIASLGTTVVRKDEFSPVKKLVYGAVAALVSVIGTILAAALSGIGPKAGPH